MSYDLWVNQMTSPDEHLLLLNEKRQRFFGRSVIPASILILRRGIIYTVDVTKTIRKENYD